MRHSSGVRSEGLGETEGSSLSQGEQLPTTHLICLDDDGHLLPSSSSRPSPQPPASIVCHLRSFAVADLFHK